MKKKLMTLCLAGLMSVSVLGGIPFESDAAEKELPVEEIQEKEILDPMIADNGDVLTAIVPFTEEEIKAREEAEGKIPQRYIENLNSYLPDSTALTDSIEADAAEAIPGIDNITPNKGNVKSLVIFSEFEDYTYTQAFKEEFEKRAFASDPNYVKRDGETVFSDTDAPGYPVDSLRGYYQRASFGALNFDAEYFDFTAKHKREWYEDGDPVSQDNSKLYKDAVDAWVESILKEPAHENDNLTDLEYLDKRLDDFDIDDDYQIDNFYFFCAGGNNDWGNRWWSYRGPSDIVIGSYRLSRYIQMVDNKSKPGEHGQDNVQGYINTIIHETGHNLGLDDYYSYSTNNDGDDPKLWTPAMMYDNTTDQDGFAKMLLGWIPKENVWVITSDQVWNPKTGEWGAYTGTYNVTLEPYARKGDLALIIPKKGEGDNWNCVYDQFIMVENYKKELNDYGKYEYDGALPFTDQGLRIFRVYGKLNYKNGFIAANSTDTMIPLISDYHNPKRDDDKEKNYLGVYLPGDELTPTSDPASSFYSNPLDDGLIANSRVVDSGISITGITIDGDNMSFDTTIVDPFAKGPTITNAELKHFDSGSYVEVTFDCPVNYIGGKNATIYDLDTATNLYDPDEKWGECTSVGRMIDENQYKRANNVLYYKFDKLHITDGTFVIPAETVISDKKVFCGELAWNIQNVQKDALPLTITPASGVYYEAKTVTISVEGLPAGSKIYYTLDGSEPDLNTNADATKEYKEPFKIDGSTVVKAIALDSQGGTLTARMRRQYTLEDVYFWGEKDDVHNKETTLKLDVKERFYLFSCIGIWSSDADKSVTYTSDDPKIAFVDNNGVITAMKEGETKIRVTSANTSENPAICTVTVTPGVASALKEKVVAEYGIKKAGDVMRQISQDLDGAMTLGEFGNNEISSGIWVASIPSQTYTGKPLKPEVRVYDGIKVMEPKNYTVSYKNNKVSGKANVTVKIKDKTKKVAPIAKTFDIEAANLDSELVALEMGVKYNGKLQKPKPVLLWKSTGAKQAFSTSNFTITYYDESEEEVKGVMEEGSYIARITPTDKNKNFEGSVDAKIKVQKTDLLEKITIKNFKPKYTYTEGKSVIPVLDTDYKILVPKGFTAITKDDFENGKLVVQYLGNTAPGKMALIIRPGEGSDFAGSKLVYLTIRK